MADDREDRAPGNRYNPRMLAGGPTTTPVHPETERDPRDRANGKSEPATDEDIEALIREVLDDG